MAQEYQWTIRKGNTARLVVEYKDPAGIVIPTTDCIGTVTIYDGGDIAMEKNAVHYPIQGRFDIFLSVEEIAELAFRKGEYEFTVVFPNGDVTTLVDGPLIVESGRGPFE